MCAIYGTTQLLPPKVVREKLGKMASRGPDYSCFRTFNGVTFGHNRLAIIDLDSRSNQPFLYENLALVFNGEIYNYRELRANLAKKGYNFKTESDTEVICALYLEYGNSCVSHLEGMFAFVIHDRGAQILFGARDRFGQKPLYYTEVEGNFEFASDLAPIMVNKSYSPDPTAVSQYFLWKYIPEPNSIFREVRKIRAGHIFTYDLRNKRFKEEQYYSLPLTARYQRVSIGEAKEQVREVLGAAVAKRLIADVPVGVFLSGGIDSSLIAALAAQHSTKKVSTYAIKFNEKEFDESTFAKKVANCLGTNHKTILCDFEEGIDLIGNMAKHYSEPFADASAIPSMLLSKYTRKHVTVALSGDAGDEAFIGYERYRWMSKVHLIYKLPYHLRRAAFALLGIGGSRERKLIKQGLTHRSLKELYKASVTSHTGGILLDASLGNSAEYDQFLDSRKNWFEKYSDFDIKTYLNGDINTKVDRASMAFSLEVRAPFLDHKVVELAKSLPISLRYNGGELKYILKELLSDYIPRNLFDRPKRGFTMPFRDWFRGELRELVLDTITEKNLKNIPNVDSRKALTYVQEHMHSVQDRYGYIWSLLVYIQWMQDQ